MAASKSHLQCSEGLSLTGKEWVKACNGECDYDFIAFDFESDDVEALKPIIEVSKFFADSSDGTLTFSGYTICMRDPFGSKG
jgi:hypothetical protein